MYHNLKLELNGIQAEHVDLCKVSSVFAVNVFSVGILLYDVWDDGTPFRHLKCQISQRHCKLGGECVCVCGGGDISVLARSF